MEQRYLDAIKQRLGIARSRRQVLGTAAKGTLGGVGATLLARGPGLPGLGPGTTPAVRAQPEECPPVECPQVADPFIRRNVYMLSDGEIASLRRGVAVMKQRRPSDPTSWSFQANLHAVPVLMPEPVWCQHASWFFFPWHRIYLYWFERILRAASGDPSLTLPYWNYSDDPAQRALPRAYGDELDAAGLPNPLFEPRRAPGINDGRLVLSDQTVNYSESFENINFFSIVVDPDNPPPSFGGPKIEDPMTGGPAFGALEATPHGGVHVDVGGRTGIFGQVFPTEGTFEYRCSLHPSETARIEVRNGAPPPPQNNAITVFVDHPAAPSAFVTNEFGFDPVVIPPGATVFWVNEGFELPHTATANEGAFDSGLLEPPGIMRFTQLASRDPIFWLHHANIDRLWERWLASGEGRANPVTECEWMNQAFTFYREDGSPVSMAVRDVLDMTNCLGYRYDDPQSVIAPDAPPAVSIAAAADQPEIEVVAETPADRPIGLGLEPESVSIDLTAAGDAALTDTAAATPVAGALPPRIILTLQGIRDRGVPGATYGVYVNVPAGETPDPAGEAFVGTISLFGLTGGTHHGMAGRGSSQSFDITRAVRVAQERGDWQGEVEVTFVPQGLVPAPGAVASPATDITATLPEAAQVSWLTIERITVSTSD